MNRLSETLYRFTSGHVGSRSVELVYTSHPRWPLPFKADHESFNYPHVLTVSVLDSSFNPPTMAHLALSRISPPSIPMGSPQRDFDARLVLFSIKNADKTLKPDDATHLQRLEMMALLARELERTPQGPQNVAVAVCQEPTFVGKSKVLRQFLRERLAALSSTPDHAIQLCFLVGFDTLERIFASKYYGSESAMKSALLACLSPSGDNSRIICAQRSAGASYSPTESGTLDDAAGFIKLGAIEMVKIGEDEQSLSSSEIREVIKGSKGGWKHKVPSSVADYIEENNLYKMS